MTARRYLGDGGRFEVTPEPSAAAQATVAALYVIGAGLAVALAAYYIRDAIREWRKR